LSYASLPKEEKAESLEDLKLSGDIEFKNISMRYQEHLDPAVKNLSFKIQNGQKVAVVGRTGAGKSSFF